MKSFTDAITDSIISEILLEEYVTELATRDNKLRALILGWCVDAFTEAMMRRDLEHSKVQA